MRLVLDFSPHEYRAWLEAQPAGTVWRLAYSPESQHALDPLSTFIYDTLRRQEQHLSDAVVATRNSATLIIFGQRTDIDLTATTPEWCAILSQRYCDDTDENITLSDAIAHLEIALATQEDIPPHRDIPSADPI
jgi:hypothetical protein